MSKNSTRACPAKERPPKEEPPRRAARAIVEDLVAATLSWVATVSKRALRLLPIPWTAPMITIGGLRKLVGQYQWGPANIW